MVGNKWKVLQAGRRYQTTIRSSWNFKDGNTQQLNQLRQQGRRRDHDSSSDSMWTQILPDWTVHFFMHCRCLFVGSTTPGFQQFLCSVTLSVVVHCHKFTSKKGIREICVYTISNLHVSRIPNRLLKFSLLAHKGWSWENVVISLFLSPNPLLQLHHQIFEESPISFPLPVWYSAFEKAAECVFIYLIVLVCSKQGLEFPISALSLIPFQHLMYLLHFVIQSLTHRK